MLCQGLCDPMESRHHRLRTWLHIQHPTRLEGPRYANRDSSMPNAACMASACGAALDGRSPLGVIQYVSVRQLSWGRCIPGWPRSILWYRIHRVTLPNLCFFFFFSYPNYYSLWFSSIIGLEKSLQVSLCSYI